MRGVRQAVRLRRRVYSASGGAANALDDKLVKARAVKQDMMQVLLTGEVWLA